tara:strand:+ start:465 stop:725 length:261 start_codon:yes stop_codon:yes gene_type:complete
MKGTPFKLKQKLSNKAAKDKAVRDKKMAMSPARKAMKAENQRLRRSAIKKGVDVKGKDYDHYTKSFVSSSKNRAGMNPKMKGTKNE